MAEKIKFDLISPEKILLSREVDMVTIPGGEGDYGVMHGHQPMITTLRPGIIQIDDNELDGSNFYVDGGFAEITNGDCSVLADDAVVVADLKKEDIQKRLDSAEAEKENYTNDLDISINEIRIEVLKKLLVES